MEVSKVHGQEVTDHHQVADVTKTFGGVSCICDKGNTVTFLAEGVFIEGPATVRTKSKREKHVYVMLLH